MQDNNGRTALHYAVARFDIAKMLVNHGADVNVRDNNGDVPLHIAITDNRNDSIKLLLSRSSIVNASNNKGELPIHLAVRIRNTHAIKLLLQHGASLLDETVSHDIVLFISIQRSDYQMVKNLVRLFYANVNVGNSMGVTPLHVAIETGNLAMIKLLIELGANVNLRCANGSTPIHYAVSRGNYSAAKLLLKYGANVNTQDQDGNTPLHIAVNSNFTNIAQLLRQNGAKIYIEYMSDVKSHDLHSSSPSSNNTKTIESEHNKSCAVPNRCTVAYNHDINQVQLDGAMSASLKQHCTIDNSLVSSYTFCNDERKNIVSEQQNQSIAS